ncbi:hypothetical protein C9427_14475 [Mesorhizobium helmanticense]|uniref:Uncharacterized protein n=1 Tax=Mesorhizobium helmanticense TaxID=1776423 RepID=A0A2T4IW44_9HYPH|nr:hypothetical protein C9427_14475 [Mesorhizobium helmanticense]
MPRVRSTGRAYQSADPRDQERLAVTVVAGDRDANLGNSLGRAMVGESIDQGHFSLQGSVPIGPDRPDVVG